jgi:hypothetical protein
MSGSERGAVGNGRPYLTGVKLPATLVKQQGRPIGLPWSEGEL